MAITVLGIDLGKNTCSVAGFGETGRVVLRRRLTRDGVVRLGAKLPACTMAMEACCGAHRKEQCHQVWLPNLDADEVMPPDIIASIQAVFVAGEPPHPPYRVAIAEIFPGESQPHPWAYRLTPVRLYRKDRGRYSPSPVHDRVDLQPSASVGQLPGLVHHFSVRSLGDQLDKLNRYSDQQADDLEARGVVIPTWRVFVELPANFLKAYLGRRHFVRGTYGFLTCLCPSPSM